MSLKYHLVRRRDMRKGASENDTLLFGQVRSGEKISIRELCESIAYLSSASPGDVSCVLYGLQFIMKKNLVKGNLVELGDLGNFHMIAGSTGVENPDDFHTSMFKKAKIVYTPGTMLREITGRLTYTKASILEVDEDCDRNHAG